MEVITVAVVTAVLSGIAGQTVTGLIALHAEEASVVWVAGEAVSLAPNTTVVHPVALVLEPETQTQSISVIASGVTHELQMQTIGRRTPKLRWWLPLLGLPVALLSVRVRVRAD